MKAVICSKYGPPEVLKVAEVDKPTPKRDEVLIRIRASAVTMSDIYIRGSKLPFMQKIFMRLALRILKPKSNVIGLVLAGEIDSVGASIKKYRPGDKVFGLTGFGLGAYAQYKCLKETDSVRGCLAKMPENISYEEATSAAYGGLLALQYLEQGGFKTNAYSSSEKQKVLIYGASGTTGTIAIQYAKYHGAEVTAICSTKNMELIKSMGADHVVDYTTNETLPSNLKYHLVLDAVGKMKTSKLKIACKNAVAEGGKYISIDDGDLKLNSVRLDKIREAVEKEMIKPVIDSTYPMDKIVDAHRYVEKGHKKGGVAITIPSE
jgi:NADPH:quinone reductase-like Zn-dependent oxidoreductase